MYQLRGRDVLERGRCECREHMRAVCDGQSFVYCWLLWHVLLAVRSRLVCRRDRHVCVSRMSGRQVFGVNGTDSLSKLLGRLVFDYGGCVQLGCVQTMCSRQVLECDGCEQLEWMHIVCSREVLECDGRDRRERVCRRVLCARAVRVRRCVCGLRGWDVLGCDRCDELCSMPGGGVFGRGACE